MPFDHWLAFVLSSAVLLAIPGPTVLLVISYALQHGRKPAPAVIVGVALGDLTAMTISMIGLGALLSASAMVFTMLRWAGGAYLVILGIKMWRAPPRIPDGLNAAGARPLRMMAHAYAVTLLNPKGIVFFVAFVPQFFLASAPFMSQAIVLDATFFALSLVNAAIFSAVASAVRRRLQHASTQRVLNRTSGVSMIAVGLMATSWKASN